MKAFVFAMEKEASYLMDAVTVTKTLTKGFATIRECLYEDIRFLVVISGVGKAFAAASIAVIMENYQIDSIVNFGIAGTLNGNVAPIGTAVISSSCVEHDMDTSAVGDPVGMISGINISQIPCSAILAASLEQACADCNIPSYRGQIASGDIFFPHGDPRKEEVIQRWHPICIDMESAPFAQIAYVYDRVPFVSVRLISDWKNPAVEYFQNMNFCFERIKFIALRYLENEK